MGIIITGCIAFIFGLFLNIKCIKTKKEIKTHDLKKKHGFAKKFDYFEIKEYSDNTFKLVYFNKPYSEDFSE